MTFEPRSEGVGVGDALRRGDTQRRGPERAGALNEQPERHGGQSREREGESGLLGTGLCLCSEWDGIPKSSLPHSHGVPDTHTHGHSYTDTTVHHHSARGQITAKLRCCADEDINSVCLKTVFLISHPREFHPCKMRSRFLDSEGQG